jgi:hypothetical protein
MWMEADMQANWQLVAAYGPWLLALMGAAVSIWPPNRKGKWHWLWLAAFVVVGVPTGNATYREMQASDSANGDIKIQLGRILDAVHAKPGEPIDAIVSRISSLESAQAQRQWEPLTQTELAALITRLKGLSQQQIGLACATPYCKGLTDQLVIAFTKADWHPILHHGGGIGVDGVLGIVVDSCNGTSEAVKDAFEAVTPLRVAPHEDMGCHDQDFLVVGEKPF